MIEFAVQLELVIVVVAEVPPLMPVNVLNVRNPMVLLAVAPVAKATAAGPEAFANRVPVFI